jgi:glycosyltransferase involved in cell wall biosynthesis
MKANVIHTDLNPCGGAEQLSIGTIHALIEMDIEVELTTVRRPDISRLKNAFGDERMGRLFDRIKKFNLLGKLPIGFHSDAPIDARSGKDANNKEFIHDIVINTHGDVLPYYLPSFSPRTTIVYCHYPVAIDPIRSRDLSYLKYLSDLGLVGKEILNGDAQTQSEFWYNLQQQYLNMLRNSLLLTNSNFSKEAILKTLESNKFATNVPLIIPPPVNVEEFRRAALFSAERKDYVLVVSRIHPSKKLENAIELARILKHYRIAKGMVIAGSLVDDDIFANDYYQRILDMIRAFGLSDYVTIEINVGLARLKSLMRNSKAYFHPLPGEPFGISIVEAMSAGLIPVVPDSGGHTEFVPKKYQFDSLKAAADVILSALDVTQIERLRISNLVINISLSEYSIRFQRAIRTMLISSMNAVPAISRERLV